MGEDPAADARVLTALQDTVELLRDQLNAIPFIARGRAVVVTIGAGATVPVPHGLGYKPQGWLVCRATGSAPALFEVAIDTRHVTITHSGGAATTVTLWVY